MKRKLLKKSVFDEKAIRDAFIAHGIKEKHVPLVIRHVLKHRNMCFEQIESFPVAAVELLKGDFCITSRVVGKKEASDGSTSKLMIELQDGQKIETVIMRYGDVELRSFPEAERKKKLQAEEVELGDGDSITSSVMRKFKSNKRATICVSSQVGCAMGCKFCATGTMGLLSNLTHGEILEQLYHARGLENIRNVVFMGMGEPLDNYEEVLKSVQAMIDPGRFGLAASRISISTVGVVPKIYRMIEDIPQVSMALSLHAPDQETRLKIVPTAKIWSIDEILEAVDAFVVQQNEILETDSLIKSSIRPVQSQKPAGSNRDANRRRKLLVEYVLLGPDVNCSDDVAHKLGRLMADKQVRLDYFLVNVIPYNPTSAGELYGFQPPGHERTAKFLEIVRSYGVNCMVRQELGQDVNAACGQLVVDSNDMCTQKDIEDISGAIEKPQARIRRRVKHVEKEYAKTPVVAKKDDKSRMFLMLFFVSCLLLFRLAWVLYRTVH